MRIVHGSNKYLEELSRIESLGFPESEAASYQSIKERLEAYPNHFYILLNDDNEIVSYINGMCTNEKHLQDKMYEDTSMHDEDGNIYMIFSVCTNPKYLRQGYASMVMKHVIKHCLKKEIVLTCKEKLIPFYASFGFINEGISGSTHGNVHWYQMRLVL